MSWRSSRRSPISPHAGVPDGRAEGRRLFGFPVRRSERWALALGPKHRPALIATTFALVAGVGMTDYLTGYEISFLIFYLLPVALAAWFVGRAFAVAISLLSAAVWLACDLGSGNLYTNPIFPAWNGFIALSFFLVVTWLLSSLKALLMQLEVRVAQRTLALTEEMAERARLEKDVLDISEREQRRIGHDLHDGLGQHLTGTALAGQVLADRLAAFALPEAQDAERIVGLIEDGIELTRSLARGLSPVAFDAEGVTFALDELASQTTSQFYLPCSFHAAVAVRFADPSAATHLYRIAQEAVGNAIRHGRPSRIAIALTEVDANHLTLTISDDGIGIPARPAPPAGGLGLRIMAHRARMIGAVLNVGPGTVRGTVVECRFPRPFDSPIPIDHDQSIASRKSHDGQETHFPRG